VSGAKFTVVWAIFYWCSESNTLTCQSLTASGLGSAAKKENKRHFSFFVLTSVGYHLVNYP